MQDNLNNMETFFKYNLDMKRLLHTTIPKEENRYNKEYLIEYSDNLFKALNDVEYYIRVILDKFNFSEDDKDYFRNFIIVLKQELIKCGYDYNKLIKFHEVCFSTMSEQLVEKVGTEIKGDYIFSGVSLREAKSINEILHIVHQTIVNNENNYRSLPILSKKENYEGNKVTLYGKDSEVAKSIFNVIPYDLSSDFVEIMSLSNDRIILMVRDVGHALSIEIEKENDKYYVKYFIPKICNIEMVNALKGVSKVTDDSNYTTGIFETTLDKLPFELVDFINKVPTDKDLPCNMNRVQK